MSISRKNWSALSSLTRQWTVEDEEEAERERRRKIRSSSSTADPDDDPVEEIRPKTASSAQDSPEDEDQSQVDFMDMLRVRDERRRKRHEEAVRRNNLDECEQDGMVPASPRGSQGNGDREDQRQAQDMVTNSTLSTQEEKSRLESQQTETPTKSTRKFVSSLSISFDKGSMSPPSGSGLNSPLSPTGSFSPALLDHSPTVTGQDDDTQEHPNRVTSPQPRQQTPFRRQNYRAWSFRLTKKKEEQSVPFQRSASFRTASKYAEASKVSDHEEEKQSPFQRNSRQRISSRSIHETMEKLALAAQKSEGVQSPTAVQRNLYLADEVSRRRELFQQTEGEASQRNSTGTTSTWKAGSGLGSYALKSAGIASKRQLWEKRAEEALVPNSSSHK